MKKPKMRFETVPLAEVINDTTVKLMDETVEKLVEKEGPYAVRDRGERSQHAHALNRNSSEEVGGLTAIADGDVPAPSTLEGKVSKRVFVIDDEECIADTLAAILRTCGYEATALYDGETAWSACNSRVPDLVISDVMMPGMSGIDLAVRIKERYPACKVLLFSGMASTADLLENARRQGHDFELLAKPIHPADLLSKMAA